MYDNAQRSLWAEQVAQKVIQAFPALSQIGQNILVTVSYPYSCSRGAVEKIQPATFDTQWAGNENEKDGFLAIHPIAWKDSMSAAKAMLWGLARAVEGPRWGAASVGLTKNADASLDATLETEARLKTIIAEVGEPPTGFGTAFPVRPAKRGRMVAYHCGGHACPKVYCTSSTLNAQCVTCSGNFTQI